MLQPRPPNTVVPHQSHMCAPTCVRAYKHTHTHKRLRTGTWTDLQVHQHRHTCAPGHTQTPGLSVPSLNGVSSGNPWTKELEKAVRYLLVT